MVVLGLNTIVDRGLDNTYRKERIILLVCIVDTIFADTLAFAWKVEEQSI